MNNIPGVKVIKAAKSVTPGKTPRKETPKMTPGTTKRMRSVQRTTPRSKPAPPAVVYEDISDILKLCNAKSQSAATTIKMSLLRHNLKRILAATERAAAARSVERPHVVHKQHVEIPASACTRILESHRRQTAMPDEWAGEWAMTTVQVRAKKPVVSADGRARMMRNLRLPE
ncbi:hypothetical protein J8273_2877 [Carpediemonas membranifera]|uniref:Uncharacterized protein n=1 Tax=Carpediemonas membranifera TaxID=201153 RepID=A0A8J6B4S2_9EUKA|nr:hypothetical protein J8273_2877 [Carpediemonas membranifera]|eukprot:KAG9395673.1 hypothetical protein J8273_2877 [Carpediemonas membranifera]